MCARAALRVLRAVLRRCLLCLNPPLLATLTLKLLPLSLSLDTQVGTYPMRVFGFDLDARLLPAAGCGCKKPKQVTTPSPAITNSPPGDGQGWNAPLVGLI